LGLFSRVGCGFALGLFLSVCAQSAVIYQVTVTTDAPLNGTPGIVNMQFNPGDISSQLATATVSGFSGATLGSVEPPLPGNGVITGDLGTTLGFTNTAALNDFAQNVSFGPLFQFILTLDGPAVTAPNNGVAGTRFSLLLYEAGFSNPLVTVDGVILTIDINPDGTITIEGFPTGNTIVSVVDASGVPEPSTWILSSGALSLLFAIRRRIK
jgi:hypothetical protein